MQLRTLIVGIAVTAILVVVLGVTRLMEVKLEEEVFVLNKLEPISLDAPPEPVDPPDEVKQELAPPPPPSFESLSTVVDFDVPAIPHSEARFDPTMEVEMFSSDIAPAEIPVAKVAPKPVAKPTPPRPSAPKGRPQARSYYNPSDLDAIPRQIRKGNFRWPRNVRDNQVKTVLYVELDEKGRVSLIKVRSISNKNFSEDTLKRVLAGYRYTVPTRGGKPTKSRFDLPLTLNKP
ncbi:hypothetical protein SAMN02745181_1882 [Rubritalea squalenifaciens DSM 18772]|uniref:TonB family C-terminal domain-containing protein n=1 Tax=Rubritalea squalenifaciens DSM 18772 TaxID=1123071 RepID=A0A1M6IPV6_9BACT|nr:hypothetical protein [Rubritalea squalenifaciens]SHJ36491.1 hypothetical protein SAMN02745181_1882 [Rubritalea squalenifaciens DSM 18772]